MNAHLKNVLLWVVLFLVAILLWGLLKSPNPGSDVLNYTAFMQAIGEDRVAEVVLTGSESGYQVEGKYKEKDDRGHAKGFTTYAPKDDSLIETLRAKGVVLTAREPGFGSMK